MLYNLDNILDRERFKRKVNSLYESRRVVELTEKSNRTRSQNSYLHLIIGYLAIETGNSIEWVKREYFKKLCNRELFVIEKDDKYIGKSEELKSSRDLSKEEMTLAIERFRNWSSETAGIYLPSANEQSFLDNIEIELSKHKKYL